jgi:hypothetical protein
MRDGWSKDSSYLLMDCGPHGSLAYAHAHADALSIEFAALGKTWIVDPGTFTYTANPELRDWFRSTKAHSTVTVDGKSQSVTAGPFSWERVANASLDDFIIGDGIDYLEASHDGYRRLVDPVKHTRTVINPKASARYDYATSLPSYLIVRDAFTASGLHQYAIRYHLGPECAAFASENHVTVTGPGGRRLNITAYGQSRIRARIARGWLSRVYGQLEPSLIVVFEASGEGPQEFTTLIVPSYEGQSIAIEHQPIDFVESRGFQVISDAVRDVVLVNSDARPLKCGSLTTAGIFSWARFENDAFARGLLIRGSHMETRDGFAFRSTAPIKHCTFRRTVNGIEGYLNDGVLFDRTLGGQTGKGEINGKAFEVFQPVTVFSAEDSWFEMSDNHSEAIN